MSRYVNGERFIPYQRFSRPYSDHYNMNSPFHVMKKMTDVAPSVDTLFFRGISSRRRPDEVREYLEEEAGCKLTIEFTKLDDIARKLFIALRFPTRDLAKDILEKYDNGTLMGDRVTVSWFKDLRKANRMLFQNRSGPMFNRQWQSRRYPRSPMRDRYRRESRSYSRSRSRSRSGSRKRSSSRGSSKSSGSGTGRKMVRSTAIRRQSSSDRHSPAKDSSPLGKSHDKRVINLAKPRGSSLDRNDSEKADEEMGGNEKGRDKSKERSKERKESKEKKKRSHSSDSDDSGKQDSDAAEEVIIKRDEVKESRKSKKRKHKNGSKRRAKMGAGDTLSDGEIESNRSLISQGPASPTYEGENDGYNVPNDSMEYDVDKILEANEALAPQRGDTSDKPTKQEQLTSGSGKHPAEQGDGGLDALLSMSLKADKSMPTKAGLTADQMLMIRDKKDDLERAYKTDCETFVMVCKMLISKDPTLEDRVLPSLRENLKEIGQRCILELREFMDRIQGEDSYRVF